MPRTVLPSDTMEFMDAHQDLSAIEFPDHLEAIRLLGHGSMASVYLARDRSLKRLVAVKFLSHELCKVEKARQRFEREAQAVARLSHDSITTVYSVGRNSENRPYIEMEYVDGVNLEELLKGSEFLAVPEACQILKQIASALAAAHEQSIVHRDIKPANILVKNTSGAASLTDFGVAAILQTGDADLTRLTREGERLGDPRYMSPEQLRGEPLTGQSDVYSLGVVAFELLVGAGPFDDPEVTDIASAHIRRPPPELAARNPSVPQWLSDTIKRCLSKKPEHRPRAKDLERLLQEPEDVDHRAHAAESSGQVSSFLHELKQRKVYRAAAAYAAITFVLLQVIDLLLQPWPQLNVAYQIAVIACIAGFPITIILAWIYDLRRGKLVTTIEDSESVSAFAARKRNLLLLGVSISLVVAILVAWWKFGR